MTPRRARPLVISCLWLWYLTHFSLSFSLLFSCWLLLLFLFSYSANYLPSAQWHITWRAHQVHYAGNTVPGGIQKNMSIAFISFHWYCAARYIYFAATPIGVGSVLLAIMPGVVFVVCVCWMMFYRSWQIFSEMVWRRADLHLRTHICATYS